jgi:hypothetical protein
VQENPSSASHSSISRTSRRGAIPFARFVLTGARFSSITQGVLRAVGLPLMAVAMLSLLGGHWAILQAVAWSQMLRDYSRDASLGVAVEKTFSGDYPCALCKRVAEGQRRESQKTPLVKLEKKSVELAPDPAVVIARPPANEFRYPPIARSLPSERFDAPPRPVPRALVG